MHAELASAETAIAVSVGDHAPRLRTLKLITRAMGAHDREWTWSNLAQEPLPHHVQVDGAQRLLEWRLDRTASRFEANRIEAVYVTDSPQLRLVWQWRARAARGPLEHSVVIQNLSGNEIWLPLQPSFRFDWQIDPNTALERFWVEKGADTPSAQGTHLDPLNDDETWQGTSSSYARPIVGQPREMIPYLLVAEAGGDRRGWFMGIEFSGRTRITLQRQGSELSGEAGLDPAPGPYRTRVAARGSFAAPTIFIGAFSGGPDGAANIVRRWVRAVLSNPRTLRDPTYPEMVNNSWGSGMAVDETLARRMIAESAQLGLEMFHLDAGWFRGVGDWHADPVKFPHGIASVADFAHRRGLKFGLWADWAQAGTSTVPGALNVFDPDVRDWLIADPPSGWTHAEPFKGITIDLGVPAAKAWAARELERMVSSYHLDMLEHDGYLVAQGSSHGDHPAAPPEPGTLRIYEDSGFLWADGSNSTDVSYHATRAYYDLYEQLRAHHPDLLLEVCNDGGRMMDFGSAAHGDYFSVTDSYDPLSNRRAFYDASYVFPPAMLESYVEKWPAPRIENFRYVLRSGMLGWFSLMLDTSQWTAPQRTEARKEFALYKSALRPLIRDADLYHVAERPDGVHWDGIEYFSATRRRGVLYAFRGAAPDAPTHRFRLSGLNPAGRYRLEFQDRGAAATLVAFGRLLMHDGVQVTLDLPLSSELVFLQEIP
ncbi:MAG TPA: alpha-galactosidase [Steroidobacteraceae bacterium]|nr:alpha-galactosidase [Steroidobacteraceae bacterium]